jgi:hypothetical protein
MRITKLLLICMCCLIVAPAVWGQAANSPTQHGILGYLDPHTGAFRPVPLAAEEGTDSAPLATFGGTVTVTLTITVKSAGITKIECTADVAVIDAVTTSARIFEESATSTGTTKTCKLTIPYSWALATQSSDTMSTTYSVLGIGSTVPPQRTSTLSPLDTRKVPANGVTTNLTASVTI